MRSEGAAIRSSVLDLLFMQRQVAQWNVQDRKARVSSELQIYRALSTRCGPFKTLRWDETPPRAQNGAREERGAEAGPERSHIRSQSKDMDKQRRQERRDQQSQRELGQEAGRPAVLSPEEDWALSVDPAMQVISDLGNNHLGEWGSKI